MMIKILSILLLIIVLPSCTSNKQEHIIEVAEQIDYRKVLFEGNDSLLEVELSSKIKLLEVLKENNYWFDESIQPEYKWFHLKLKSRLLKVGAFKEYFPPGVRPKNLIEVVLNKDNQLMFERELSEISDLDSLLFNELMTFDFYKDDYLIFQWDENSSLKVIDETLIKIEKGYSFFYDEIAKKEFNQSLNNLSLLELNKLKEKYPFEVIVLVKRLRMFAPSAPLIIKSKEKKLF